MSDELNLDSGTAEVTGGVGNGQATGTGHVAETFNVDDAISSIGVDLFGKETPEVKTSETEHVAPAATPEVPVAEVPASEVPAVKPAGIEAAPKTWKPEEAAAWAQIPDAAKAAIVRREEDIFKGIEQYRGQAQLGQSFSAVLRPYEATIRSENIDPMGLVSNLLQTQYNLATGSAADKTAILQSLAKSYGVDLSAEQSNVYEDPQVSELKQQIARLESGQTQLQQQRAQETYSKAQQEVETFANDPANVHFNAVSDEMTRLLQMDRNLPLAKAYEMAVWSNPVIRDQEIARINSEKQSQAAKDAQIKATQVRAATAVNVRVQPKVGAATLPLGTMEDTMAETMRDIKSRS